MVSLLMLLLIPLHGALAELPDRSGPPPVDPPVAMALAEPVEVGLWEGARLLHVRLEGVRRVQVVVSYHLGYVDLFGGRPPVSWALGAQLATASGRFEPEAFEIALDQQDAAVDSWVDRTDTGLRLNVAAENLEPAINLVRTILEAPRFSTEELRRAARDKRAWLSVGALADAGVVGAWALHYGWYPAEHPYGARPDLRADRRLQPDAVAELFATVQARAAATVLVVGPVERGVAERMARILLEDHAGTEVSEVEPSPPANEVSDYAIDQGGSQVSVRLRVATAGRDEPEAPALGQGLRALAGTFDSRLNGELREDRGWTYGVSGNQWSSRSHGYWTVNVDVPVEHLAETVRLIEGHLSEVVDAGIRPAELEAGLREELAWWNRRLETTTSAGAFYQRRLDLGESVATARSRVVALESIVPADVAEAAQAWVGPDSRRSWVFVGPGAGIQVALDELDREVRWLSPEQAVLGDL